MKKIKLKNNLFTLVDDSDFEYLSQYKWCLHSGYALTNRAGAEKRMVYMHRLIMDAPEGMEVDHINHDPLDNRRENLRVCTHSENGKNKLLPKNNTSGYKGVYPYKGKYKASIRINGDLTYLGMYWEPEDAARAYNNAAAIYFGEYASVNPTKEY